MKKTATYLTFLIALLFNHLSMFGQAGYIHTVAGGGTSTANGVPATAATLSGPDGVGVDAIGNIYFAEHDSHRIRKVDVYSGLISTVAGNGTPGFSGDGGPATNAQLWNPEGIFVDPTGNVYIVDANTRIRRVDAATGYINTVVGGGTLFADGVPATATNIGEQHCVFVDNAGNIYCSGIWLSGSSAGPFCLRQVNAATGIITTIAGGGLSMADGVPATSEYFPSSIRNICLDDNSNIYMMYTAGHIRKIDAMSGIISTVAGAGTSTADGIPATDAALSGPQSLKTDAAGNLFLAESGGSKIRRIDATTGIINIIAGGGTSEADGSAALSALVHPYELGLDAIHGIIYYSDFLGGKVRNFSYSPIAGASGSSPTGSFSVYVNKLCNGPELMGVTPTYIAGRSIKTYFGDGATDSSVIIHGFTTGGYTMIHHSYPSAGIYTIKQILFNGAIKVDSISHSYNYAFCRSLPVKLYFDENGNCVKDISEPYSSLPILINVDSNGTSIKTISATSGFLYNAYGVPGDIYKFKVIPSGSGISATCPTSGIITDTVFPAVAIYSDKYFGLHCSTSSPFDNSLHAVVPVTGVHDQWADIYVQNSSCVGVGATVTLHYSKKYSANWLTIHPAPTAYSDSTITWNLTGISADMAMPVDLYYALWSNPATGDLTIGDTVHSYYTVTPISGDSDPSNNSETRIDTVKAGCDPNEIFVSPANCLAVGSAPDTLQYTLNFENTGNDTAHNIYVMDTLSASIDPSSIRIITASATMNIQMLKDYGYNIVRFDFPNINLPDSSHHGLCDGAVIFSARTWPGLAYGTQIPNRAGIYFDINPVVMTNTVQNTKGCPATSIESVSRPNHALLYPNPATDELTIKTPQATYTAFTISNSMGQVVMQQDMSTQAKVDIKALSPGLYFVTLRGSDGNEVQKFIKW